MEEWKEYKLGDFMEFNPKVKLAKNTLARKITMDQLIPHCRDIHSWTFEPYTGGTKFENGDTIMARITPCLENGKHAYISCLEKDEVAYGSTEYIVIRGRKDISDNDFVYYLSHFPDFKNAAIKSMVGTSGRQRAQVDVLENLKMYLPPLSTQRQIASILSSLDDKIELNRKINANLEAQAQALFNEMLMNEVFPRDRLLKDYAFINPTRTLKKGELARYIDMTSLPTKGSFPSDWVDKLYNGGMKFQNGDTLMARITPCLENGKTAYINFLKKDEIAFGSTEYIIMAPHEGMPSEMFYFLARNEDFVSYAVAHMNGSSGRQRVSASDIENYIMPDIPIHLIEQFGMRANVIMETIKTNSIESRRLASLRDTLLPRLMSGELKVNEIVL